MKSQGSAASNRKTLQSQIRQSAQNRLSINALDIVHGQLVTSTTRIPSGTLAFTALTLQSNTATTARLSSAQNAFAMLALVGACNPDFNITQAGIITRWSPMKNLTFSGDFTWTRVDQKYFGTVVAPTLGAVAKPAAIYELKDQDSLNFLLRVQRNF